MNIDIAFSIMWKHGLVGTNNFRWTMQNIDMFMQKYPRGKGIKKLESRTQELYDACLTYKIYHSRTKNYKVINDD